MNFGFIIDNRKCIGCHACTVACKSEHQVPVGVNRTWVKYIEKGEFPDTRAVGLPGSSQAASTTAPHLVPEMIAASLVPSMMIVTTCSVPSALVTSRRVKSS